MCIFLQGIDREGSQCCQNALGHAHRHRQRQPVRAGQEMSSKFSNQHVAHVLCVFFLRGIYWEGSQCRQNALRPAHRRRQRQPGPTNW